MKKKICIGTVAVCLVGITTFVVAQQRDTHTTVLPPTSRTAPAVPEVKPLPTPHPHYTQERVRVVVPKGNQSPEFREVNGAIVTYEFGKGNPKEVAVSAQDLSKDSTAYWGTPMDGTPDGNFPYGYVTGELELMVLDFLRDPNLPFILNQCYEQMYLHANPEFNRPALTELSLKSFFYIDERTKRKEVDLELFYRIVGGFEGLPGYASPTEADKAWRQCLTPEEYQSIFKPLHSKLITLTRQYHFVSN